MNSNHKIARTAVTAAALMLGFASAGFSGPGAWLNSKALNAPVIKVQAQVLNPLYIRARELWGKVSAAALSNEIKAPLGQRFGDLSREQQALWGLAHQVDSGSCAGGCMTAYNARVAQWQGQLQLFNHDAGIVLLYPPTSPPNPFNPTNGGPSDRPPPPRLPIPVPVH